MVQNTFYGGREDLPFDLRVKAGPLQFSLARDADASEKARVSKDLVAMFTPALAGYLAIAAGAQAKRSKNQTPVEHEPQ
ncbi:hypothetical protein HFO49_35685 [Rhizobium leguminosarum]|uniref:hypothetical protein n=1 Tax=Rhizobium leguminosarum TaxID=384 RepID=UPI001C96C4D1|nr:hypothetical protein [Rhizobium leguminosarum]MBY5592692.1 hypothetical protein [Rhizobium leguminosarum]MBY5605574.1 hypothetical protein [Rhizobium leguminosarum]